MSAGQVKIQDVSMMVERARDKKDGVFSYKGFPYAVKSGRLLAYANYYGDLFHHAGRIAVSAGKVDRYDRRKSLLKILEANK